LMQRCGHYDHFIFARDYSGRERVVQMRKKMLRSDA
jgi:hypothetical protein